MNFYVSFLNNIALKIVAKNVKYVWQLTESFNTFYFYCNLFCHLLTYLFIYSFTLCCVLKLLICFQKKEKKTASRRKEKVMDIVHFALEGIKLSASKSRF